MLLVEGAITALEAGYALFGRIEPELARGKTALTGLSRNARARSAWPLVVALGGLSRPQLARALGLSRAGADIQAHASAGVGLVKLGPAGWINWVPQSSAAALSKARHGDDPRNVFAEFDASIADIDRLMARAPTER